MTPGAATVPAQLASTRKLARLAGALYAVAVAVAVFAEFVAHRHLPPLVSVAIPIACYAAVTLLLLVILRPVNQIIAMLATVSGLLGLGFEAFGWQPAGVNIAMVLHGVFCLLIGYLLFRSTLIPRLPGQFMGAAGLMWLLYLDPPFARSLAPVNTLFGLVCESIPMLWLLIFAVGAPRPPRAPVRRRR